MPDWQARSLASCHLSGHQEDSRGVCAKSVPKRKAKAKTSALKASDVPGGKTSASSDPMSKFPLLVAALQAGMPETNLEQMQRLLSRGKPGTKVKNLNLKAQPDYLSEGEAACEAAAGEEFGWDQPQDLSFCQHAGCARHERLNVAKCAKTGSLRAGEASNPGPRRAASSVKAPCRQLSCLLLRPCSLKPSS